MLLMLQELEHEQAIAKNDIHLADEISEALWVNIIIIMYYDYYHFHQYYFITINITHYYF